MISKWRAFRTPSVLSFSLIYIITERPWSDGYGDCVGDWFGFISCQQLFEVRVSDSVSKGTKCCVAPEEAPYHNEAYLRPWIGLGTID